MGIFDKFIKPLIGPIADIGTAIMGSDSQRQANRQNILQSREQRAWEEMMSNTAVRRRADDIEAAGGNRALAFTSGSEASTPSYTPARVEPVFNGRLDFTGKAIAAMQAQQIQAQTRLTSAQAQGQEIKNSVDNVFAPQVAALNLDIKQALKDTKTWEYDHLQQKLDQALSTALAEQRNKEANTAMTGLQAKQFAEMTDAVKRLAIAQAREQEIDVEALENLASIGGTTADKARGVVQTVLDAMRVFFKNRK